MGEGGVRGGGGTGWGEAPAKRKSRAARPRLAAAGSATFAHPVEGGHGTFIGRCSPTLNVRGGGTDMTIDFRSCASSLRGKFHSQIGLASHAILTVSARG